MSVKCDLLYFKVYDATTYEGAQETRSKNLVNISFIELRNK